MLPINLSINQVQSLSKPSLRLFLLRIFLGLACCLFTIEASGKDEQGWDPLPESVVKQKREGSYYTGIPAVALNPDLGLVLGGLVFRFSNGQRSDSGFASVPYATKASARILRSTLGYSEVAVGWNSPQQPGELLGYELNASHTANLAEPYFGVGSNSMQALSTPESSSAAGGESFSSYKNYRQALQEKLTDGTTYAKYNFYKYEAQELSVKAKKQVGWKNIFASTVLKVRQLTIYDFSGDSVSSRTEDGQMVDAIARTSHLRADADSGRISGYDGGHDHQVSFGLAYDTRDFEPDPGSGFYSAVSQDFSSPAIGASHSFVGTKVETRAFLPLNEERSKVLALRASYAQKSGDVPFYALNSLGGRRTMRGFRNNRFAGLLAAQGTTELRMKFSEASLAGQDFKFVAIPFVDAGQVFDRAGDVNSKGWRTGSGLAVRAVWNQATVIGADYSVTGEGNELYVDIEHVF